MRAKEKTDKLYDYWNKCISKCDPNDERFAQINIVMNKLLSLENWYSLFEKYEKSKGIKKMYYKYLISRNEKI